MTSSRQALERLSIELAGMALRNLTNELILVMVRCCSATRQAAGSMVERDCPLDSRRSEDGSTTGDKYTVTVRSTRGVSTRKRLPRLLHS